MNFIKWGYWIFAIIASGFIFEFHGRSAVQQEWNIDKARQAQHAKDAFEQRQTENAALIVQQTAINNTIQKAHDEEIRTITTALPALSGCASAPISVLTLPDKPTPKAPPAAMEPIPPAGYFLQKWTALLGS